MRANSTNSRINPGARASAGGERIPTRAPAATATPEALELARASVVCGTDFSENAGRAAEIAALLAGRLGEQLVLVHAVNERFQQTLPEELREPLVHFARERLHDEQERLGAECGGAVETSFRSGRAATVLLQEAAEHHARLLVLAAGGDRETLTRRLLGTVAERVAERADVPTLVVRDATPRRRGARGQRRLRVLVGADFSAPSEAALTWVYWLRRMGACEIVVACLEAAPPPNRGREVFPSLFLGEMAVKTAHLQERVFREHVRELFGVSHVRARYERGWAHSDRHLIHLASEERADLIVVGTHSRTGWHRLGHHSISRGVLHYAPSNVVCVPDRHTETAPAGAAANLKALTSPLYEN